jgi:hypothetical protein
LVRRCGQKGNIQTDGFVSLAATLIGTREPPTVGLFHRLRQQGRLREKRESRRERKGECGLRGSLLFGDRLIADRLIADRLIADRLIVDRLIADRLIADRLIADKIKVHILISILAKNF